MTLTADLATGTLMTALLLLAAWSDVRTLRIPNVISLGGAVLGLGAGAAMHGWQGAALAAAGWSAGLAVMLPLYALRTMGAGDIKLVAMTGAFFGFPSVFGAVLSVLIAGGVFALLVSAARGRLAETFGNVSLLALRSLTPGSMESPRQAVAEIPVSGHLPYAVPILAGTTAWWLLQRLQ